MTVGKNIAVGLLVFVASINVTPAQVPEGRIYSLHSRAVGACPSLDWHIVVEANGILAGIIAWNDMKTMARVTGKIDHRSHTFEMVAREIGGRTGTATVEGRIQENGWIVANIKGPQVICDAVIVPYAVPPGAK